MGSMEILSVVCLGATALFALLTLGLAGFVVKLYTEYFKDQKHDRRQKEAKPLLYEGTPQGDKILGTIESTGEALLSVADRDKFIEAFNAPLKFGHPMPAALTVPARAAILAYHRHLLHRLVELGRADQRGR